MVQQKVVVLLGGVMLRWLCSTKSENDVQQKDPKIRQKVLIEEKLFPHRLVCR